MRDGVQISKSKIQEVSSGLPTMYKLRQQSKLHLCNKNSESNSKFGVQRLQEH